MSVASAAVSCDECKDKEPICLAVEHEAKKAFVCLEEKSDCKFQAGMEVMKLGGRSSNPDYTCTGEEATVDDGDD